MTEPVSKTVDSLMNEAVIFYESGDVYQALHTWKQVLSIESNQTEAQRYIEFVQGHFKLPSAAQRAQVETAVNQYAQSLRQQTAHAPSPSTSEVVATPVTDSVAHQRQPIAEVSETAKPAHQPAKSNIEELATVPPPIQQMAESSVIAKKAMIGPSGPKTQADGLSIKSLSRLLAELHRAGKYEQAVQTAESLLNIDPQHAVAKRYIQEYNRQKQAALSRQRSAQRSTASTSVPASAKPMTGNSTTPKAPRAPSINSSTAETSIPANYVAPQAVIEEEASQAPTVVPSSMAPDLSLDNLSQKPKVLMRSDQITWQNFDHRAGFFLSQVDGNTSYEDLIDISGMGREDAIKILSKLVEKSVIGH